MHILGPDFSPEPALPGCVSVTSSTTVQIEPIVNTPPLLDLMLLLIQWMESPITPDGNLGLNLHTFHILTPHELGL